MFPRLKRGVGVCEDGRRYEGAGSRRKTNDVPKIPEHKVRARVGVEIAQGCDFTHTPPRNARPKWRSPFLVVGQKKLRRGVWLQASGVVYPYFLPWNSPRHAIEKGDIAWRAREEYAVETKLGQTIQATIRLAILVGGLVISRIFSGSTHRKNA